LKHAITTADDISLLCELMRYVTGDIVPDAAPCKTDNLGEETAEVREMLLERIRSMAAAGVIHKQIQPRDIFWFWWGTGNGAEVRNCTAALMKIDEGLRVLLRLPIS